MKVIFKIIFSIIACAAAFSLGYFAQGLETKSIENTTSDNVSIPKSSAKYARSVALVYGNACNEARGGTGWIIGDNLIATNAHVVLGMRNGKIAVAFGKGNDLGEVSWARVVAFDVKHDIAILATDTQELPLLKMAGKKAFHKADYYAWGHKRLDKLKITPLRGMRSIRHYKQGTIYQVAGSVEHGDSGSPMFNESGNVVGMIFGSEAKKPFAYAVPLTPIKSLLKKARKDNLVSVATGNCNIKFN